MSRTQSFFDNLPSKCRSFLRVLFAHKTLTKDDVVRLCGLQCRHKINTLTGPVGRWAPVRNILTPFERDGDEIKWCGDEEWQGDRLHQTIDKDNDR